jgi:hypothetical protein
LFKAVVVIGASLTAGGCGDDVPVPDAAALVADGQPVDAPTDAGTDGPPPDVILIL